MMMMVVVVVDNQELIFYVCFIHLSQLPH